MSGFHLYGAVFLSFAIFNVGSNVSLTIIYLACAMAYMTLGFSDDRDKQK